ncbi:hypothetical protein [Streptomyces sodiiphilus]
MGDYALREIDASALRTFKTALLARVEESTAEVIWGHLSSILGSAVDDQRLLRNPMKATNSVKPPRATDSKAKAWSREVVDTVRAELQDRYQIAVDLGIGLGLRQGEAFGLAEEDFASRPASFTSAASSGGTSRDALTSRSPRGARSAMSRCRPTWR